MNKFSDSSVIVDLLYTSTFTVTKERLRVVVPYLIELSFEYETDNRARFCHFVAQLLHESGEFIYSKELASGVDYEFRSDLGNTQKGDGARFKGRGFIQLTGRKNYEDYSLDRGVNFVQNPTLLESLPESLIVAFWYWSRIDGNNLADAGKFNTITRRINGGENGIIERWGYLNRLMTRWDKLLIRT